MRTNMETVSISSLLGSLALYSPTGTALYLHLLHTVSHETFVVCT
jgi:hypothetical protein